MTNHNAARPFDRERQIRETANNLLHSLERASNTAAALWLLLRDDGVPEGDALAEAVKAVRLGVLPHKEAVGRAYAIRRKAVPGVHPRA
ncbi:MAG: hypothetical protein MUE41_04100 [Gemmatimonadaceae bacterium]|jgi:hypothetical protein|nr:hypothetical protein [Gemmatimonadaceae bacterium]